MDDQLPDLSSAQGRKPLHGPIETKYFRPFRSLKCLSSVHRPMKGRRDEQFTEDYFSTAFRPGMRRRIRKDAASVSAKASGATVACLSNRGACQSFGRSEMGDQDRRMEHIDPERVPCKEPREGILDVEVLTEEGDKAKREADGDEGYRKGEGEALPVQGRRPSASCPGSRSAGYHDYAPDGYPPAPSATLNHRSPAFSG